MSYQANKRLEIKSISNQKQDFISEIKIGNFYKEFENRKILSIYFDTDNFLFYRNHIDGVDNRVKYRLRAYPKTLKKRNFFNLEIKKKENDQIFKKKIDNFITYNLYIKKINPISTDLYGFISPVVGVKYEREYFRSFSSNLRVTVDSNLEYFRILNYKISFNNCIKKNNFYVREYKHSMNESIDIKYDNISKFSKYVDAIKSFSILDYD